MIHHLLAPFLVGVSLLSLSGCGSGVGEAAAAANAASSIATALSQAAANSQAALTPAVAPAKGGKVIYVGHDQTVIQENGKTYVIPKPEWQR